jgi:D-alanyl-D-alanine carboxypeptidase/D-alanyl-D-alanine-endopeptidase (penicillin-binding protein 4)
MHQMKLIKLKIALSALALTLLVASTAGATTNVDVKAAMNKLGGGAGAYAYNVTDGHAVAGRNSNVSRILASNTKLFTGAAALARYGTGGRFATSIYTSGTVTGGVLTGDVYLRGGGDPLFGNASFVTTNFGSRATVEQLAKNLEARGVTSITGRVYGDETAFDSRRGMSSDVGGILSGLIFNKGYTSGKYQTNPPLFAAQKLSTALRAAGVDVGKKSAVGTTPTDARRLTFVTSLPMSALVRQMAKPSNNYLAEMLVKSLALPESAADDDGGVVPPGSRPASTFAGDAWARKHAASFGSKVALYDGSGLSRGDKSAPREVVDLLRGVSKSTAITDFRAALPIAGVDGTLANRMKNTAAHRRCSAKTGTLSNVSTLSGYCTSATGDTIAFSILQNRVNPSVAHGQQDRLAAAIAGLR